MDRSIVTLWLKLKADFKHQSVLLMLFAVFAGLCGCGPGGIAPAGYSNRSLFPEDVTSVYIEMFGSQSLRRGIEYELTDALAKRIEAQTPYKVISSPDRADTVLSGRIVQAAEAVLVSERETGRALEKEVRLEAVVNWKNLKSGQLLINNEQVGAAASYSQWQNQGFDYAAAVAANKLAQRIVELMEKQW